MFFNFILGKVCEGLLSSLCGNYIIYPLGSFVVIKNIKTEKEAFLDGHSHEISCIAMSSDGYYLASGQLQQHGIKVKKNITNFTLLHCNNKH